MSPQTGPSLHARRSPSALCTFSGWEDQLLGTENPLHTLSCCCWRAYKLLAAVPQIASPPILSPRRGREPVLVIPLREETLELLPDLGEDALNACFVSPLLRVGCCQMGSALPLWQGTLAHSLPSATATGPATGPGGWVGLPGVGVDLGCQAALNLGSLPRAEVRWLPKRQKEKLHEPLAPEFKQHPLFGVVFTQS